MSRDGLYSSVFGTSTRGYQLYIYMYESVCMCLGVFKLQLVMLVLVVLHAQAQFEASPLCEVQKQKRYVFCATMYFLMLLHNRCVYAHACDFGQE